MDHGPLPRMQTRRMAFVPPPMIPSPNEYFSINRFLYDILTSFSISSFDDLENKLLISKNIITLRIKMVSKFWYPSKNLTIHMLINLANSIRPEDLSEPPLAYRLYHKSLNDDTFLGFKESELIIQAMDPINRYHIDYINLLFSRVRPRSNIKKWESMKKYYEDSKKLTYLNVFSRIHATKFDYLSKCYDNIPDCIKNLSGDERFLLNSELSVAYLYGVVTIPKGGISSPHLHGCFSFTSRRENTGYLSLEQSFSNKNIPQEKLKNILEWLKNNNDLYRDFSPLTYENYEFRIDPNRITSSSVATSVIIPNNNNHSTDKTGNVYIRLKKQNGNEGGKYIPLEEALALCFPLLFPFGKLEKIPGNTLREKSRSILASHEYYRCGRL